MQEDCYEFVALVAVWLDWLLVGCVFCFVVLVAVGWWLVAYWLLLVVGWLLLVVGWLLSVVDWLLLVAVGC